MHIMILYEISTNRQSLVERNIPLQTKSLLCTPIHAPPPHQTTEKLSRNDDTVYVMGILLTELAKPPPKFGQWQVFISTQNSGIFIHSCPDSNGGSSKRPSGLRCGLVITCHLKKWILKFLNVSEASTRAIWTICLLPLHLIPTSEIRPGCYSLNSALTNLDMNLSDTLASKLEFAPSEIKKEWQYTCVQKGVIWPVPHRWSCWSLENVRFIGVPWQYFKFTYMVYVMIIPCWYPYLCAFHRFKLYMCFAGKQRYFLSVIVARYVICRC